MQLGTGCVGDGTTATDLVLDIRGDGRTYGPGEDAVRLMNARPGASNLQIEGRADCGGRVGDAHQDGIQVLGGTNVTFRNFQIGNYDAGLSTCQGAGGAFFYSLASTNTRVEGGKYIACNHSLLANAASGHVSGAMFRSGRTDGTDPICVGVRRLRTRAWARQYVARRHGVGSDVSDLEPQPRPLGRRVARRLTE